MASSRIEIALHTDTGAWGGNSEQLLRPVSPVEGVVFDFPVSIHYETLSLENKTKTEKLVSFLWWRTQDKVLFGNLFSISKMQCNVWWEFTTVQTLSWICISLWLPWWVYKAVAILILHVQWGLWEDRGLGEGPARCKSRDKMEAYVCAFRSCTISPGQVHRKAPFLFVCFRLTLSYLQHVLEIIISSYFFLPRSPHSLAQKSALLSLFHLE